MKRGNEDEGEFEKNLSEMSTLLFIVHVFLFALQ